METYREKLKLQNVVFAIGCVALALFSVLGFLGEAGVVKLAPSVGDGHWQSRWRGFISGASFGILVLLLTGLIRNLRALKDEKKLKKLYIKESDERQAQIVANALCAAMRATLILGLAAVIVAGYFSMTVSVTLLVTVLLVSLMTLAFKLYFGKNIETVGKSRFNVLWLFQPGEPKHVFESRGSGLSAEMPACKS